MEMDLGKITTYRLASRTKIGALYGIILYRKEMVERFAERNVSTVVIKLYAAAKPEQAV